DGRKLKVVAVHSDGTLDLEYNPMGVLPVTVVGISPNDVKKQQPTESEPLTLQDRVDASDGHVVIATVPKTEEKPQAPSNEYGANNTLVSQERYEELKRRMQEKLKGQMNMGVDPEILSIGVQMAVYHIEAGARKFADFAKNMVADLGDAIRPYLKSFYNGARDLPEMEEAGYLDELTPYEEVKNFDVLGFDKGGSSFVETAKEAVKENEVEQQKKEAEDKLKKNKKNKPQGGVVELVASSLPEDQEILNGPDKTEETSSDKFTKEQKQAFSRSVASDMVTALATGQKPYRSIVDVRKKAQAMGMDVDMEGRDDIVLQELVEYGIVTAARDVVESGHYGGSKSKECFDAICKLYEMQPTISMRSSNRVKMQQYSTPLPMGFVADMFAYKPNMSRVLEPTAGNGMLVFAIPANKVIANELDETRLDNLKEQGFSGVFSNDALTHDFSKIGIFDINYDAVIANPPFGSSPAKEYDGKMIGGLDEQITLNALSAMKDDGRAAIIIGGNMEYGKNGGISGNRAFWTYLYDHYNVKGVMDMDGKLYGRQGTTYPTRMILIDGRRSEEERAQTTVYPPVK
ncbi:MAG: hypothetical protein J5733_02795, partial [Bacteroidaceae bacterium]|nr:hypothetical protein [Bacteroidaceae bacterium]